MAYMAQNNWSYFSSVFDHVDDTMSALAVYANSKIKGLGLGLPQMGS